MTQARVDLPFNVTLRGKATVEELELTKTKLARTELAQEVLIAYPIPLTAMRVHDDLASLLPGTAANDDLAIVGDTFGTESPHLSAGDLKAAGATTRRARFTCALPAEYDDAETVNIRVHAGMLTTVADTSCTIDVEAYESDEETGISSDLCTTDAQDMNSLTFADLDFTLTATDLVSGDILDVRISIACNDSGTGTVVEPACGAVKLLCDIRG